jgi:hypothetical protein
LPSSKDLRIAGAKETSSVRFPGRDFFFQAAPGNSPHELAVFRTIIVYNFSFSMVLAGPGAMVVTRYLADAIYGRDVREVSGSMLGASY